MNKYADLLAVHEALEDAEVPMNNRFMYYLKYSWWRHPIKRWRQRRWEREILATPSSLLGEKEI